VIALALLLADSLTVAVPLRLPPVADRAEVTLSWGATSETRFAGSGDTLLVFHVQRPDSDATFQACGRAWKGPLAGAISCNQPQIWRAMLPLVFPIAGLASADVQHVLDSSVVTHYLVTASGRTCHAEIRAYVTGMLLRPEAAPCDTALFRAAWVALLDTTGGRRPLPALSVGQWNADQVTRARAAGQSVRALWAAHPAPLPAHVVTAAACVPEGACPVIPDGAFRWPAPDALAMRVAVYR
jgi:hypothetical protein